MSYALKSRRTKPFELYNDLEVGDLVELGFFLKTGEIPRRSGKPIVTEQLWVKITQILYESNEIYNGILTEEPRYLKQLRQGDSMAFSPENVLSAKSRKPAKRIRSLTDFVYHGDNQKKAAYKQLIWDGQHTYAIDPALVVLRTHARIAKAVPTEKLDKQTLREFEDLRVRFDKIELDKYHVRVESGFIKKSLNIIRAKANTQASMAVSPLIRISDRTYLSFNLVSKLLILLKKMLIYLEIQDGFPMVFFTNETYDGFITLANQRADAIIVDVTEKLSD